MCSPVICPYPDTNPRINESVSVLGPGIMGNKTSGSSFEHYWSKTSTIPLYLIILLLPLLSFRSASFFARFTFFGRWSQSCWDGGRNSWDWSKNLAHSDQIVCSSSSLQRSFLGRLKRVTEHSNPLFGSSL